MFTFLISMRSEQLSLLVLVRKVMIHVSIH